MFYIIPQEDGTLRVDLGRPPQVRVISTNKDYVLIKWHIIVKSFIMHVIKIYYNDIYYLILTLIMIIAKVILDFTYYSLYIGA